MNQPPIIIGYITVVSHWLPGSMPGPPAKFQPSAASGFGAMVAGQQLSRQLSFSSNFTEDEKTHMVLWHLFGHCRLLWLHCWLLWLFLVIVTESESHNRPCGGGFCVGETRSLIKGWTPTTCTNSCSLGLLLNWSELRICPSQQITQKRPWFYWS